MKKYLIILGALLIITNVFWIYRLIDFGVTYSYQQVTLEEKEKAIEILSKLVVGGAQSYTQKDMLHILRQNYPKALIVVEENRIGIQGVTFIYKNETLKEIKI